MYLKGTWPVAIISDLFALAEYILALYIQLASSIYTVDLTVTEVYGLALVGFDRLAHIMYLHCLCEEYVYLCCGME